MFWTFKTALQIGNFVTKKNGKGSVDERKFVLKVGIELGNFL